MRTSDGFGKRGGIELGRARFGGIVHWGIVVALAAAVGLTGCGDDESEDGEAGGEGTAGGTDPSVTYHRDVAPILTRSCAGCHQPGEIAPFAIDSYESAKPLAASIAAVTASGTMPPFHAVDTDDCDPPGSWADDPRLSEEEIALLRTWKDLGAPEGDPADAPELEPPTPPSLDRVDVEMLRDAPTIVDGANDLFPCVIFDPAFDGLTWIDGIHLAADNTRVAHHAITYKVPRAQAEALSGGASTYECLGGAPGEMVHGWVPGGLPFDLPPGVGIPMGPDDVFIVQMHYHPTGTGPETDASSLQLRITEETPEWQLRVQLRGNARDASEGLRPGAEDDGAARFLVPAFAEGHVEEMEMPLYPNGPAGEAPLLFVGGHMHFVGRDIRIAITPEGGNEQCLLQIPDWDFNWQGFYQFDAPIDALPKVHASDRVNIRCTYDNVTTNGDLHEVLTAEGRSQPVDVSLGEGSLDEMCIAVFGVLLPAGLGL